MSCRVNMPFQKSTLRHLFILIMVLWGGQPDKAMADVEICNEGDTWVYFAALAWNSSLLRDEALVEGFTPIEPDKCTSIIPYGMSRIYISLFIYDRNGNITNPVMVPQNASSAEDFSEYICVQPQQAFRRFSNKADIKKTFTPPCPDGYIRAKTSFMLIRGNSNLTLRLNYDSDKPGYVWGKTYGAKRQLQSIWAGERQGFSERLQENAASARDRDIALALLAATGKYMSEAKKRQDEENARRYQVYLAKKQAFEKRVAAARKAMEKPADATCTPYLEKEQYDDFKTLAIAGVQLGMDVRTAHQAIICNGFSMLPELVARAGGIEKVLKKPRGIKYSKQIGNNKRQEIELETRGDRVDPNKPNRIASVRVRFSDFQGIDNQAWENIQDVFIEKYDLGRERRNQYFVHYKSRNMGRVLKLESDLRRKPMISYTVSLCCGG